MKPLVFIIFFLSILSNKGIAQPKQGQLVEDIALPTPEGDTLRLSNLKGKLVLLDFWASWCVPCRMANKGMGKIYSKFKEKGFEIYSVSLDEKKMDWIRAIKKDNITWKQVNTPGSMDSPIAIKWRIEALPTSYLIDKQGVLIAMNLEGKELEQTLKYLLGK